MATYVADQEIRKDPTEAYLAAARAAIASVPPVAPKPTYKPMSNTKKKPLKAVSLHRPWSYCFTHLGKSIENRGWECPLEPGELLALHAGIKFDDSAIAWVKDNVGVDVPPDGSKHPIGIVAIATFLGNVDAKESPWFVGPLAWELGNIIVLPKPVPMGGRQRLWTVEDCFLPELRSLYLAGEPAKK